VPTGADTVVMQEKVTITNEELIIADHDIKPGTSVRPPGSEIKAGTLAMNAGSYLSPAAIGFLAGIGHSSLSVYPKPRVSIIVTGKELQKPGKPLAYGQVYESNSLALRAALQQVQVTDISVYHADDDPDILTEILRDALNKMDLILLAGGISVGDYDFVAEATKRCGVTQLFHKIKQRPGKPLFFGIHEKKPVFGLPGNPSSVLTCFYEYVIPCLEIMTQRKEILKKEWLPISRAFQKNTNLTHFLKGYSDGKTAMPLDAQESYRMSSYAVSNCLIVLEEEKQAYTEGEKVEVHFFPE
jgi:molybdopterin molybdotransferase